MLYLPSGVDETKVKSLAEEELRKLNLSWEDVEEVIPAAPPAARQFLTNLPNRHTHFYLAKAHSIDEVTFAAKSVLESWQLLRSVAIDAGEGPPILVTLRCNARYLAQAITIPADVQNEAELDEISLDGIYRRGKVAEGLLCKIAVVKVGSIGTCAIGFNISHAVLDQSTFGMFLADVHAFLNGGVACEKVKWSLFANAYRCYSLSLAAEDAITFHSRRLEGLGSYSGSLWPGTKSLTASEEVLASQEKNKACEQDHIVRYADCQKYPTFQCCLDRAIRPVFIVKAAIALFNSIQTDTLTALISVTLSGRSWPFLDESIARYLPDPKLIAGPTLSLATDIVQMKPEESIYEMLMRLTHEQVLLTRYEHCPLRILDKLSAQDRLLWGKRRQIFNWLPYHTRYKSSYHERSFSGLEICVDKPTGPAGPSDEFTWRCGLLDSEHLNIDVSVGSQLFHEGALARVVQDVFGIIDILAGPEHWDRKVGEVRAAMRSKIFAS